MREGGIAKEVIKGLDERKKRKERREEKRGKKNGGKRDGAA